MLQGFKRCEWSPDREILRMGVETVGAPSLPCHTGNGRLRAGVGLDPKTDLNYFFTEDERINSGVVIRTDPAQRPKLLSALVECCLVKARVYRYQALYSPAQPHSSCTPREPLVVNTRTTQACSSFLHLEFETLRICISTTLLIQGLKRAREELSHWLRWRKGTAFFQLAAFS